MARTVRFAFNTGLGLRSITLLPYLSTVTNHIDTLEPFADKIRDATREHPRLIGIIRNVYLRLQLIMDHLIHTGRISTPDHPLQLYSNTYLHISSFL